MMYQQLFGMPCVYSDADGVFLAQSEDGLLRPVSGRYAVAPSIEPGVYRGKRMTPHSVIDTNGQLPYTTSPNGTRNVDEHDAYNYGSTVQGPVAGYTRRLRPITDDMSQKSLEYAIAQRWAVLLRAGGQLVGGAGSVARVGITASAFYVNGVPIYANETVLGDSGLRITDIVDFAELFSYYKELRQLDLAYDARLPFAAAYSNQALPFMKCKTLQAIVFTKSDGLRETYTRAQAAASLKIPEDRLHNRFNSWATMSAQVNKGETSAFCKPGSRLVMADYTKRLAAGAFGPKSTWSKKRRFGGALLMAVTGLGTVISGGVQLARASQVKTS